MTAVKSSVHPHHYRFRFALYGAAFGLCFPILGTALQSYVLFSSIDLESLWRSQLDSPLLWIIDTAPFFLGLFASFAGEQMDKVGVTNRELERKYDEMKELRELADEANKAKSYFLANMSHEIRTPMNAIIGLTYLTLKEQLQASQRDRLQKIQGASESLMRIINDLLDFSKIEAGETSFEKRSFRLETVVNDVAEVVNVKLRQKENIEFIIEYDSDLPVMVESDPLRLRQVLINLLDNAVKFTHSGDVKLTCRLAGQTEDSLSVYFEVSDSGIGISQGQMERLFTPFQQADISTTRKFGGTGLGLTISRSLVSLFGGDLKVDSVFGSGSSFSFTAQFSCSSERSSTQVGTEAMVGLKVLLVDDSDTSRSVLGDMLKSFKFTVDEAPSGAEALRKYRAAAQGEEPYSLIVTDWRMPEMDGLEMMEFIRQEDGPQTPCVLMITAYGSGLLKETKMKSLIDGYLTKPVSPSFLFDAIQKALYQRQGSSMALNTSSDSLERYRNQLAGLPILLVEDNEINTELAVALLEDVGIVVQTAADGIEALERAPNGGFAGILMDIQMPRMDGLTAAKRLRKMGVEDIPIIAMTAHAMAGEREKSLAAGMNEHITKPIVPEVLYSTLVKFLDLDRQREAVDSNDSEEQTDSAIPSIEGLDTSTVLMRLGGKAQLYRRLLERFAASYTDASDQIEALIDAGEQQDIFRHMHTLGGLAGNVGATEVHGEALVLSERLRHGGWSDGDAQSVRALSKVVSELAQRIQAGLEELPEQQEVGSLESMLEPAFDLLLKQALHAAAQYDPSAIEPLEEALRKFVLPRGADQVRAAVAALQQMEFEEACGHLEKARQHA